MAFLDIGVATDMLTDSFFQYNTKSTANYKSQWRSTRLLLECDFPQPPTIQHHRLAHDILIAEYVEFQPRLTTNTNNTPALPTDLIIKAKTLLLTDDDNDAVVVAVVGIVKVDGRRPGRIPWKRQPHVVVSFDPLVVEPVQSLPLVPPDQLVYVCNLAVRKSWRRRGVASLLMGACEELVGHNVQNGAHQTDDDDCYQTTTHLCLSVRKSTPWVMAMYQSMGYVIFQPSKPKAIKFHPTIQQVELQQTSNTVEVEEEEDDPMWWMAKTL